MRLIDNNKVRDNKVIEGESVPTIPAITLNFITLNNPANTPITHIIPIISITIANRLIKTIVFAISDRVVRLLHKLRHKQLQDYYYI